MAVRPTVQECLRVADVEYAVLPHHHAHTATEDELEWLYPDCETGAMPPLGPLYRQLVFVERRLTAHEDIAFNAGTFDDAVVMRVRDFLAVAKPVVGSFARAEVRHT